MNDIQAMLEFDKIKEQLTQHACSRAAKEQLLSLSPSLRESECQLRMQQTSAARRILDVCGAPPLPSMKGISKAVTLCEAEAMLEPEQLEAVSSFFDFL